MLQPLSEVRAQMLGLLAFCFVQVIRQSGSFFVRDTCCGYIGINFVFFVLGQVGDIVHVVFGVAGDDGSIAGGRVMGQRITANAPE